MGATTDQLVPVVDPANRAVRLAAFVCVWDMEIPFSLLSLYGRVFILGKSTGAQYTPTQYSRRGTPGPPVHAVQLGVATWANSRPRDGYCSRIVDRRRRRESFRRTELQTSRASRRPARTAQASAISHHRWPSRARCDRCHTGCGLHMHSSHGTQTKHQKNSTAPLCSAVPLVHSQK